jgi:ABC-2 type transport system permease protein
LRAWLVLLAYSAAFAALAAWGYRRDEGRRYG